MDSTSGPKVRENAPAPTPPQLQGYSCDRLLGRGGSASVWLIRNASGEPFALKVIDPSGGVHRQSSAARREEWMLHQFRHEHLLAVHEVVSTEQGMALRMDYAPGGSLLNLVSVRGPLPPGEVVTVLTPMAQVIAYLHEGGAVHGDVSPGNLLFTELGKPLLADLGVGRLVGEGRHVAAGTPGFQEALRDPDRLNTESDIYALAAVGWYALTGRVPGPAIQRPPLSLLVPDTPADLMDLINRGLDGDPSARPGAHEFARAVQATAPAEPLDLVGAVHPEVLPSLRTRWSDPGESDPLQGRRRRGGGSGPVSRRSQHSRAGAAALALAALTLLAAAGVLIAGSQLPGAGRSPNTEESGGPSTATSGSTTGEANDLAPFPSLITQSQDTTAEAGVSIAAPADRDPLDVLPHLSQVRERAFETADPDLLHLVNVEQSAAMDTDREALGALVDRGHVLAGLRIDLSNLSPADLPEGIAAAIGGSGDDIAAVTATATTSGYTEVAANGDVLRRESSSSTQELLFILQRMVAGWRIFAVHEV
ncbi:serine/threonine-protein kinase [Arthrobacter sp. H20]|uniref:serine/threonine-protein kinase n=1 Tax=Arthrobacter sp. H20 TaxID=1267981 RepID=UPI0012DF1D0C|nr:serine/threonine-protein kinase [Arthrobacter sp. H20]